MGIRDQILEYYEYNVYMILENIPKDSKKFQKYISSTFENSTVNEFYGLDHCVLVFCEDAFIDDLYQIFSELGCKVSMHDSIENIEYKRICPIKKYEDIDDEELEEESSIIRDLFMNRQFYKRLRKKKHK